MSTIEKIKSRGYWQVLIRPSEYVEERIPSIVACKSIIRDTKVSFRGWDYPHYSTKTEPVSGLHYVEQSSDWEVYIEHWRYFQSGQFFHVFSMWEDWDDARRITRSGPNSPPGERLSMLNVIYLITEVYEFAARLGAKELLGDSCSVGIGAHGTKNRRLVALDPSRHLFHTYESHLGEIPRDREFKTSELIGRSRELALEHIVWLFHRFNWDDAPRDVIRQDQEKLVSGRL